MDVYGFGVLLFELLSGKVVMRERSGLQLMGQLIRCEGGDGWMFRMDSKWRKELQTLVWRCLSVAVTGRGQMSEVVCALDAVATADEVAVQATLGLNTGSIITSRRRTSSWW